MPDNFTNNVITTLRQGLLTTDTIMRVKVGDGAKFSLPIGDYAYVTLRDRLNYEVVRYQIAGTVPVFPLPNPPLSPGDDITIIRAQDGTIAKQFPVGACVTIEWNEQQVKDTMTQIALAVKATITGVLPIIVTDLNPGTDTNWQVGFNPSSIAALTGIVPPSAPPASGQLPFYINSATGVVYLWNGATWLAISVPSGPGSTVNLTGNQTVNGIKTFTNPVVLNAAAPSLVFSDTASALPEGVWRWMVSGGDMRLQKNTAIAGDFSTNVEFLRVTSAGGLILGGPLSGQAISGSTGTFSGLLTGTTGAFSGVVSGVPATAPSHFVTKAQLDAVDLSTPSFFSGFVTNPAGGPPTLLLGPPGWTVTRLSIGNIRITHNLGLNTYLVHLAMGPGVVTGFTASRMGAISAGTIEIQDTAGGPFPLVDPNIPTMSPLATNSFIVHIALTDSSQLSDGDFVFQVEVK